jgi:hypothetical protein
MRLSCGRTEPGDSYDTAGLPLASNWNDDHLSFDPIAAGEWFD